MSQRPLVLVSALAAGDYLLWHWSLVGNHGVLALIAGLTLPLLLIALAWLLTLTLTRVVARGVRRRAVLLAHISAPMKARRRAIRDLAAMPAPEAKTQAADAAVSSRKLAA